MGQYSLEGTGPSGKVIVVGPLTALEAYEQVSEMVGRGCKAITLLDLGTGNATPNVEKLIPYPI